MPVSLINTRTTQAAAAQAYSRFTKSNRASSVKTMAGMSSCAIMLCVKNKGDANKKQRRQKGRCALRALAQFDGQQKCEQ